LADPSTTQSPSRTRASLVVDPGAGQSPVHPSAGQSLCRPERDPIAEPSAGQSLCRPCRHCPRPHIREPWAALFAPRLL